MADHVYNSDFHDYIDDGSRASARTVAPLLLGEMAFDSLLDVGAGHGAWAAEWAAAGVGDVLAVGGDFAWAARRAMVQLIPTGLAKPMAGIKARVEAALRKRAFA